jgi:hypothetical protein
MPMGGNAIAVGPELDGALLLTDIAAIAAELTEVEAAVVVRYLRRVAEAMCRYNDGGE